MDEGVIFSELVDEYTPSIPDLSDVLGTAKHGVLASGRGIRTAALTNAHLETTPVTSRDESLSCLETPSAPFYRLNRKISP